MNLTGKQKRVLRSLAQTKKSAFQIGKEGLTAQIKTNLLDYLTKYELGKITVLNNCTTPIIALEQSLQEADIQVIQKIGKVMVLYKENLALINRIELPL
ncbi:MAG: YhbY family RNA-binding protein [Firmicutes bacterium]|nr:YhbY family RNA-binding protein [Bacillota bacterium]